ncbi:DUF6868 family protein [Cognaticolwellia beringensis]|uniref:DUF6868 domain-containing protein n=1 Tax=Cognaticolwellia beringensis TaxID=1967665 RepID=A0A222GC52_9GAMM|nr:hypothetical protein [Cognaticolwellia beringensis]ASP49427.1 hypothetical protein B5D82_17610 [Cognaticolwellia beringensis]
MDINEITTFFGWCTVINLAVYLFSALAIIVFKRFTTNLHSKVMGIDAKALPQLYFNYLGNYKLGILIFNLAPYLALKLMV